MRVLVVDVGGTHVKVLATGQKAAREFSSGPTLTAEQMVAGVKTIAADWKYEAVSVGYPGPVLHGRPVAEPRHLGPGLGRIRLSEPPSDARSRSSTTPRCRRWAATRAARCSSSAWEPVSARPSSSTASWSRWSWATCRTGKARSRSTSDCTACTSTGSRNGGRTSRTSSAVSFAALEPEDVVLGGGEHPPARHTARRLPGRRQRQRVPRGLRLWKRAPRQASRCTTIRGITQFEIDE